MNNVGLSIIGAECKSACEGESDFERRIKKAMSVVANGHWMFCGDHEEDLRFRGAIAGVLQCPETTDEEKKRIIETISSLRTLGALMAGIPVDMEAMAERMEEHPSLPLVKWWHEAKAA